MQKRTEMTTDSYFSLQTLKNENADFCLMFCAEDSLPLQHFAFLPAARTEATNFISQFAEFDD